MRSLQLAAILLSAIALYGPNVQAAQTAPDACEDSKAWIERIQRENPSLPIARADELSPEIVAKAVALYNSTPPVEKQAVAETGIMIVGRGNGQMAPGLVGLFHDGCLTGAFSVTVPDGEGA